MPLRYRPKIHLTEREIRYAMKHSSTLTEAAMFLGVHYNTLKKYALMYVDEETGKNLVDFYRNQGNRRPRRTHTVRSKYAGFEGLVSILEGNHPQYKGGRRFMLRLLEEGIFAPMCSCCGYGEKRITDDTVPLLLDYIDNDNTNHHRDNLRLLCYNCYYVQVGDIGSVRSRYKARKEDL